MDPSFIGFLKKSCPKKNMNNDNKVSGDRPMRTCTSCSKKFPGGLAER